MQTKKQDFDLFGKSHKMRNLFLVSYLVFGTVTCFSMEKCELLDFNQIWERVQAQPKTLEETVAIVVLYNRQWSTLDVHNERTRSERAFEVYQSLHKLENLKKMQAFTQDSYEAYSKADKADGKKNDEYLIMLGTLNSVFKSRIERYSIPVVAEGGTAIEGKAKSNAKKSGSAPDLPPKEAMPRKSSSTPEDTDLLNFDEIWVRIELVPETLEESVAIINIYMRELESLNRKKNRTVAENQVLQSLMLLDNMKKMQTYVHEILDEYKEDYAAGGEDRHEHLKSLELAKVTLGIGTRTLALVSKEQAIESGMIRDQKKLKRVQELEDVELEKRIEAFLDKLAKRISEGDFIRLIREDLYDDGYKIGPDRYPSFIEYYKKCKEMGLLKLIENLKKHPENWFQLSSEHYLLYCTKDVIEKLGVHRIYLFSDKENRIRCHDIKAGAPDKILTNEKE